MIDAARCERCEALANAARATLLFYRLVWDAETRAEWQRLTGQEEANTHSLCDFIRETLQKVER